MENRRSGIRRSLNRTYVRWKTQCEKGKILNWKIARVLVMSTTKATQSEEKRWTHRLAFRLTFNNTVDSNRLILVISNRADICFGRFYVVRFISNRRGEKNDQVKFEKCNRSIVKRIQTHILMLSFSTRFADARKRFRLTSAFVDDDDDDDITSHFSEH